MDKTYLEEKKQLQEELEKKLKTLFVMGLILSVGLMAGYIIRGAIDQEILLNVLAWWRVQRDCSECDEPTCTGASYYLNQYNLSGIPIQEFNQGKDE